MAHIRHERVRDVLVGGDVSKEEDVVAMFDSAVAQLGDLDVLVRRGRPSVAVVRLYRSESGVAGAPTVGQLVAGLTA